MGASTTVKKGRVSVVEGEKIDREISCTHSALALHRPELHCNRRNRDVISRTRDCIASFIHASLTILSSLHSWPFFSYVSVSSFSPRFVPFSAS